MHITDKLIGASAIVSDGKVIDVDAQGLVRRLLLFDKYVLASRRLQEFPLLIPYFGYEGLRSLLTGGLIEIRCECLQLTQIGQSGLFGDPILPLYSYKFNWIDFGNREDYTSGCLQQIHQIPGITHRQVLKLKRAIVDAIRPLPQSIKPQLFPGFQADLLNARLFRAAIDMEILRRLSAYDVPYSLSVHQVSAEVFRVETDLANLTKISDQEAHGIIEAGMLALSSMSQAVGEMKAYNAISGFRDEDIPLFRHKLDHLYKLASSESNEDSFQRVLDIADIPDFFEENKVLDVERLLTARSSGELRDFRHWLPKIGASNDEEIEDAVAGLRARLGLTIGSTIGKAIRVLITAGTLVKNLPASIALSAADQFLVERIFPRTGIAAFINELYPSLFKKRDLSKLFPGESVTD